MVSAVIQLHETKCTFRHSSDVIKKKLDLIDKMKPRQIEDFLPLVEMKIPELEKCVSEANYEADRIPEGHRIYFLSKQLNVSAMVNFCWQQSNRILYFSCFR